MDLIVYTDGGSLNNPGPAASAFIIYKNKKIIETGVVRLGVATNNVAEYTALINALRRIKERLGFYKPTRIVCFSDSLLMVNQINGFFKVKDKNLKELLMKIRIIEQETGVPVVYKHIPREKNAPADKLVKQALTPGFSPA